MKVISWKLQHKLVVAALDKKVTKNIKKEVNYKMKNMEVELKQNKSRITKNCNRSSQHRRISVEENFEGRCSKSM